MKTINFKKEECPYCDISLELTGDSDRSVFNWHLSKHGESLADDDYEISKLESEFNTNHIEIENPEWVKKLFHSKSDEEKQEVINLICKNVGELLKEKTGNTCSHKWEVTLTDKKQFNFCTECEKCDVLLR